MSFINVKKNVSNEIVSDSGRRFPSIRSLARFLGIADTSVSRGLKKNGGVYHFNGHSYRLTGNSTAVEKIENYENTEKLELSESELNEYDEFLKYKEANELPFNKVDFGVRTHNGGSRYAIALFSDLHFEETVHPASVLGLNEYNTEIATERVKAYFRNLVSCINEDKPNTLIFAALGDNISGYIHDELAQGNGMSPLEATFEVQNLIYNGLEYLCENTDLDKIFFIGIVGNHSRTTKKIQHANGYKMSYEWIMYKNIERQCAIAGLPIEFSIPESEMAVVDTDDDKRYIFIHGFQIKSSGNGTVCGIYPALNRLSMKWDKTFHQNKIYLGHFHSCISIPNATVNGSVIGYNSFSLTNGFQFEEPAQMYELFNTESGLLLTRQIYCK